MTRSLSHNRQRPPFFRQQLRHYLAKFPPGEVTSVQRPVYVATPLGFEPRITPPKGAVLPLHHGVNASAFRFAPCVGTQDRQSRRWIANRNRYLRIGLPWLDRRLRYRRISRRLRIFQALERGAYMIDNFIGRQRFAQQARQTRAHQSTEFFLLRS